jgi:hypothetical protein
MPAGIQCSPPVRRLLARRGDHPGDENQLIDRNPIGHERGDEAAIRLADHDETSPIADSVDHGVGVVQQPTSPAP